MKFKYSIMIILIVIVSFIGSSLSTQDSVIYYPTDYVEPEYDNITTDDTYLTNYYRIYGAVTQNLYEVKENVTYALTDINGQSIDSGVANKLIRGYKQEGYPDYIKKTEYDQYTKDFAKEREEFYKSQGFSKIDADKAIKREINIMKQDADKPDIRIENKPTIKSAVIPDYYKLMYGDLYEKKSKSFYKLEPAIIKIEETRKKTILSFKTLMKKDDEKFVIQAEFVDNMRDIKGKIFTFGLDKEKAYITDLTTQIEDLQAQIAELTVEIEQAEQELGDASQIEELEAQIEELTKQIEELQAQIDEHQDNIDELEAELENTSDPARQEELREEIDRLKRQRGELTEQVERHRRKRKELQEEVTRHKRTRRQKEEDVERLRRRRIRLEEDVERVKRERTRIQDEIDNLGNPSDIEELSQRIDEATQGEPVYIGDKALDKAIRDALGKAEGTLYISDLLTLTHLDATGSEEGEQVKSLTGIEYCENLESIDLSTNDVVDLSPLSTLLSLTEVNVASNDIDELMPLLLLHERGGLVPSSEVNVTNNAMTLNENTSNRSIVDILRGDGVKVIWEEGNKTVYGEDEHVDVVPAEDDEFIPVVPDQDSDVPGEEENINKALYDLDMVVNFPDENLEKAIRKKINKPEGEIYYEDLLLLEYFSYVNHRYYNIEDISGLEYCTSLTELNLSYNQITDISPITKLNHLIKIVISNNQISDITPIAEAKLKNLTTLDLGDNQISDITPLKGVDLSSVTELDLGDNQISDITPIAKLNKLTELDISSNQISDISPIAKLNKLTELNLDNNQITDISPIVKLNKLTGLIIPRNQITDISPIAKLNKLTELVISSNQISDITPIAKLNKLEFLSMNMNQINDISVLTDMDLSNLRYLGLGYNKIGDNDMYSFEYMDLSNLTELNLDNNLLSDIHKLSNANFSSLTVLSLSNNYINNISALRTMYDNGAFKENENIYIYNWE